MRLNIYVYTLLNLFFVLNVNQKRVNKRVIYNGI